MAILAALKGDDEPEGRVFDVSANAFKLAWARAVKRAKLEDFHFHDLRHEGTSRIAEKLSNVLELSSVTGHKDLQMAKNTAQLQTLFALANLWMVRKRLGGILG